MTEKRFVHKYDGMFHHLLDMSKKNFDTQKIQSIDECVDLLNKFYEENKQLKKENEQLKQQINELQYNKSIGQQEYQKRLFE